MSASYLGSPISLTSVRGVRYRGVLSNIDHVQSTIGLSSVYSMGTENRAPPDEFIPASDRPYDYIVFRAAEVANLALDTDPRPEPQAAPAFNDPAVLSTQAPPTAPPAAAAPPPPAQQPVPTVPVTVPVIPTVPVTQTPAAPVVPTAAAPVVNASQPASAPAPKPTVNIAAAAAAATTRSDTPPVRSASASMETVERAINDLRISNASGSNAENGPGSNGDVPRRVVDHRRRGGRRAHPQNRQGGGGPDGGPVVPAEDFDFDRSNSKFDKASIYAAGAVPPVTGANAEAGPAAAITPQAVASPEPGEVVETPTSPTPKEETRKYYDRSKSFFDDISSDTKAKADGNASGGRGMGPSAGGGGGGRGGRGGGRGRYRRDEERNKNMSTFGEPGFAGGRGSTGQWQNAPNGAGYQNGGGYGGGRGGGGGGRGGRRRPGGQGQGQGQGQRRPSAQQQAA